MPIYRYRCLECTHEEEKIITFSEKEEYDKGLKCPVCESETYSSLIGRTSFSLRGEGWYKDGYK